jgi:D-alanyl-D-alanine carboxypeptidase
VTDETGPDQLLPATRRALLHRAAVAQVQARTPSLVATVVRDGAPVWTGARSMIDGHAPDAGVQYRIGSISKTLTALLVLRLRDEGRLDLADPLGLHLPDAPPGTGDLAVRDLLAHTAGLASETPPPWWERTPGELRPTLADLPGPTPDLPPPARRHHYSNPGFALLGALVERLRGMPWFEALRGEVLTPLGMGRTTLTPEAPHAGGFAVHPHADLMRPEPLAETGLMAPAGQLWSTAADLARLAALLSGAAPVPGVLAAATLEEMRAPATPPTTPDGSGGYGLGLALLTSGGRALSGHTGTMPGFTAALWTSPADRLAAVVLANATWAAGVSGTAADLIRITAEHEPPLPAPWRPDSAADPELLALTGCWYWGTGPLVLRLRAGRDLELGAPDGSARASRFRPAPDGSAAWTGLDGYYAGETLRPVTGPDGEVTHLDLGSFVLTREPYGPASPGGAVEWTPPVPPE